MIIYAISTDDSGLILRGDKNMEKSRKPLAVLSFVQDEGHQEFFAAIRRLWSVRGFISPTDFAPMAGIAYRDQRLKKDGSGRARKGYYAPRQ